MTQDISSTPAENDPCMWGSATLVMLVSSTCMTVTIITVNVMAHRRAGVRGASGENSAVTRAWRRVTPVALRALDRAGSRADAPPRCRPWSLSP